ncbi:MAG: PAS domain-containing protein [Pseudomonadota bacterium]
MVAAEGLHLLDFVVDRIEVGIFAVDRGMRIVLWNRFMALHSGRPAEEVVGSNLFEVFPELPRKWLEKKIDNVFVLKNYSFTSWEQRPFLFRFDHNRPITGGIDCMRQNCTFLELSSSLVYEPPRHG